jgi:hypothetical protein
MCLYFFGICHSTKFVFSSAGLSVAIFRRNVTEMTVLRKDNLSLSVMPVIRLKQDYIHKTPVILHDNFQQESHKLYGSPNSATCLQVLRQQTNTGTSISLIAETYRSMCTRIRALSRLLKSAQAC